MAVGRTTTNWEIEKRMFDKLKSLPVDGTQSEGIKAMVITITPEKAKTWLCTSGKNRKVSQSHVRMLMREMLAGRWCLNGQAITFNQRGQLIDGQHRLHAVVGSGCSIQSLVTFGIHDPMAWETIDTNQRKRTSTVILEADGYKNTKYLAAAARRLLHWEATSNKADFSFTNEAWKNMPQGNLLKYARANDQEIQDMINRIKNCLPFKRCKAGSAFLAVLVILNRVDEVATYLFVDGIKTGANLPENSSIALLRDRLITPPERRGMGWELEIMALTIKAWNYFTAGKNLKMLRWRQDGPAAERFPIPRGAKENGS